ncbi:MAG TPA: flavin reductase family protein [Solirubrobacteraceae bacterium]|nr:flavin reductase family protein [Solirubrobacteraceae bacterium]
MAGTAAPVVHDLVSELDYPMFIVTATNGRERAGCLVGFATQCSINPPRFLVCLSDKNRTFRVAADASVVVVHLVPAEADALAELFGSQTGDDVDKFERVAWQEGPVGTPVLDECGNWFAGRILERIPAGDHCALLREPFDAHSDGREEAFTFHRAKRMEPGHEA